MSEEHLFSTNAGPRLRATPAEWERQAPVLDSLLRAQGLDRWAYVHVTGEGLELPGDLEQASGQVMDSEGRVFSFWLGADPETGAAALTSWRRVEPSERLVRSAVYRRARVQMGLEAVAG